MLELGYASHVSKPVDVIDNMLRRFGRSMPELPTCPQIIRNMGRISPINTLYLRLSFSIDDNHPRSSDLVQQAWRLLNVLLEAGYRSDDVVHPTNLYAQQVWQVILQDSDPRRLRDEEKSVQSNLLTVANGFFDAFRAYNQFAPEPFSVID